MNAIVPNCGTTSQAQKFQEGERSTVVERLVVYGTLMPGERYHGEVAEIPGRWRQVTLPGRIDRSGPYPVYEPSDDGATCPAWVLESESLAQHWARLDAFEGDGYRRVTVRIPLEGAVVAAQVYVAA